MNRRQMMNAFPALAAAATALAHAMPAEGAGCHAADAQSTARRRRPPAPGVVVLSYRPQLGAREMTCEDIV